MEIMYHEMRQQAFWDGNKRTATLLANKLMIDNGAGLINVPLDKWETWSNLIANFYFLDLTFNNFLNLFLIRLSLPYFPLIDL